MLLFEIFGRVRLDFNDLPDIQTHQTHRVANF